MRCWRPFHIVDVACLTMAYRWIGVQQPRRDAASGGVCNSAVEVVQYPELDVDTVSLACWFFSGMPSLARMGGVLWALRLCADVLAVWDVTVSVGVNRGSSKQIDLSPRTWYNRSEWCVCECGIKGSWLFALSWLTAVAGCLFAAQVNPDQARIVAAIDDIIAGNVDISATGAPVPRRWVQCACTVLPVSGLCATALAPFCTYQGTFASGCVVGVGMQDFNPNQLRRVLVGAAAG